MHILKFIGKVIGIILGLFVALLLGVSLFVPIYDFDEPYPFSGEYLHNPYEGMDSTAWLKCNFHAHSRTAGGIADGRKNTDQLLDSIYRCFGFDHIGISNYNTINEYGKDNPMVTAYSKYINWALVPEKSEESTIHCGKP